jgi:hypothetical protein
MRLRVDVRPWDLEARRTDRAALLVQVQAVRSGAGEGQAGDLHDRNLPLIVLR